MIAFTNINMLAHLKLFRRFSAFIYGITLAQFLSELAQFKVPVAEQLGLKSAWKKRYAAFLCAIQTVALPAIPQEMAKPVKDILFKPGKGVLDKDFNLQLIHGDLKPEHVLCDVRHQAISGIIDWGDAEYGDVGFEYARILFSLGLDFFSQLLHVSPNDIFSKIASIKFYQTLLPFNVILTGVNNKDSSLIASGVALLENSLKNNLLLPQSNQRN